MKICAAAGCEKPGAFSTRTKPTWCREHIKDIYRQGGLELLEEFTKPSDYLLTKCQQCRFEGHYKFQYVLDRNRHSESVCRACYWKVWAQMARQMSGMPSAALDPQEIKLHAEENGYEYLGPLTNPILEDDPHAVRCTRCGRKSAQRPGDIGWACTCIRNTKTATAGTKKSSGANLLKNSTHRAVAWWDHEKNDEALWDKAKLKSRFEAWWKCPQGHSYEAKVLDATSDYHSCPRCQEIRHAEWERKRAALKGKTIADVPELLAAWDESDISPESVLVEKNHWRSGYKFRCPSGHRNTRHPMSYLFGGCSACKANETRKVNAEIASSDPTFSRLTPEISSQWHPSKNGNLRLSEISPNSRRVVWWRDPVCGHEFQATPRERDKYERWRCPVCQTVLDSLAYHYPEIAQEWSDKNQVSPWSIRPNTTLLVEPPLWECKNDPTHVWKAMPSSRVNGGQCPDCRVAGKSLIELEYLAAARVQWKNVSSGHRIQSVNFQNHASWTADILATLPSGQEVVIEYDGAYWHRDKSQVDHEKSLDLLNEGFTVVRIRERPLKPLDIEHQRYFELFVHAGAQDPKNDIVKIAGYLISNG